MYKGIAGVTGSNDWLTVQGGGAGLFFLARLRGPARHYRP